MAYLPIKKVDTAGELYWDDVRRNQQYHRIVGGMAWPQGVNDGALVVLGESALKDHATSRFLIYVLHESVGPIPELFLTMQDLVEGYQMEAFLGDPSDEGMMVQLRSFNGEQGLKNLPSVGLRQSFLIKQKGNINSAWQLVKRHLDPGAKILHLGEPSMLREIVDSLTPEDLSKVASISQQPLLAALAYALGFLHTYRYQGPGGYPRIQSCAITEYDEFNYGVD
ncbi:MAG: hypothetical protein GTO24_24855 [candidate division Zixibacteria bacterium]|nr:hypothetical protein [candidate division Zixibacteria bacterium]